MSNIINKSVMKWPMKSNETNIINIDIIIIHYVVMKANQY